MVPLLLALAGPAAGQTFLAQPAVPGAPGLAAGELTGAATLAGDRAVIETFAVPRAATLQSVRLAAHPAPNAYALIVRIVELSASNEIIATLASERVAAVRSGIAPAGDGLLTHTLALRTPLALQPGRRYGLEARGLLLAPDRDGSKSWTWAAGAGDGSVLVNALDGSPLATLAHPGVAFELIGTMAPLCRADVNGDGQLSPGDFTAWIQAFNARDLRADQNGDGAVTSSDFAAWIQNYNTGCP
jgi:hypothetical protein